MSPSIPWDIYPIFNRICAEIALPIHLFQCIQVSKEWNQHFIPILWRFIDLKWNIDDNAIFSNQHHVLAITSFHKLSPFAAFPNLQSIQKDGLMELFQGNEIPNGNYLTSQFRCESATFLSQAKMLNSLYLFIPYNNPEEPVYGLPNILRQLSSLKSVELIIHHPMRNLNLLQNIICNTIHCEKVHVNCLITISPTMQQINDFTTSLRVLPETNIRDLAIKIRGRLYGQHNQHILIPLLLRSPHLVSFYLHSPYVLETLEQVADILLTRPLTFFGIDEAVDRNNIHPLYWEAVQRILQAVDNNSKRHHSRTTIHFRQSIHSPINCGLFCHDSFAMLLDIYPVCFSHTLTSLDLFFVPLGTLVVVLLYLPSLLVVTAKIGLIEENEDMQQKDTIAIGHKGNRRYLTLKDLDGLTWACQGLKELNLEAQCPLMTAPYHHLNNILFGNIGKLSSLKYLTFRSLARLFTTYTYTEYINTEEDDIEESIIVGGYLNHLQHMENLLRINLRGYGFTSHDPLIVPAEDIEFMVQSWPKLGTIDLQHRSIQNADRSAIIDITRKNNIKLNIFEDLYVREEEHPSIY